MAASVYHVISKEVENHIFGHNWSFRHTCMYIYFRYTARFFLGCAFFNAHLSIIRTSWETKKESLSYRKSTWKNLWGTSLFWQYALLSMSFFVFVFVYSLPLTKWHTCWMAPKKIYNIAMVGILCDDTMREQLKIWESLAI